MSLRSDSIQVRAKAGRTRLMSKIRPSHDDPDFFFATAQVIYLYARRWAVGQSTRSEDAVIYDACIATINEKFSPSQLEAHAAAAQTDRYTRYGTETYSAPFTLPITVEDAIVALHRFARRYTNGRGSTTASVVNTVARSLLEHGISLDETSTIDGTIWAADGAHGRYDGLSPTDRAEALAALGRKTSTAAAPSTAEAADLSAT